MQTIDARIDRAEIYGDPPLMAMAPPTAVDLARVRLGPRKIIEVTDPGRVTFIPAGKCITLGCIAGWISDEDAELP